MLTASLQTWFSFNKPIKTSAIWLQYITQSQQIWLELVVLIRFYEQSAGIPPVHPSNFISISFESYQRSHINKMWPIIYWCSFGLCMYCSMWVRDRWYSESSASGETAADDSVCSVSSCPAPTHTHTQSGSVVFHLHTPRVTISAVNTPLSYLNQLQLLV